MRRIVLFLLLIVSLLFFWGCLNVSVPPEITIYGLPSIIEMHDPVSLFVGKEESGGVTVFTLFEVLGDGTIQAVIFTDEDGNELSIEILDLYQLSDVYIAVHFVYDGETYKAVADLSDGSLLDFSEYDLSSAMIRGNNLYVLSYQTIYKVDMVTNTATPMNNPDYDPAGWEIGNSAENYKFLVVNDNNVITGVDVSGGIHLYIFFESAAPKDTLLLPEAIVNVGGGFGCGVAFDLDGYLHRFEILNSGIARYSKLTFDSDGMTTDTTELGTDLGKGFDLRGQYTVLNKERYFIYENGFYHITQKVGGGFNFDFTAKTIPHPGASEGTYYIQGIKISGQTVYSKDGSTIKKMDIINDSAFTDVVTWADMIDWWVAGNTVMFTAYITGVDIGTYKVNNDGSTTLLESSDMEIKDIVELSL